VYQKHEIIFSLKERYPIVLLCSIASVSESGYYLYFREKEQRKKKDEEGYLLIKKVFDNKKGKIGARTIKMRLEDEGIVMNLKKIRRIMNKYGLACKIRRVNKTRASLKKNTENIFVKNLLNREFKQYTPHHYASTDITYIRHQNRFSFLFFGHMKDEVEYSKLNFTELEDLMKEYMIEYNYQRKQWGRKRLAPIYYRDYLLNFAVDCV
jgi:sulfur relay (sulfurtransferase) DsrC/TusE family protein